MADTDDLTGAIQKMLASGATHEEVLKYLRNSGLEVIDSIKVLRRATGMDLLTAKREVHYSQTWRDRLDAHERFHDAVEQAIEDLKDPSADIRSDPH